MKTLVHDPVTYQHTHVATAIRLLRFATLGGLGKLEVENHKSDTVTNELLHFEKGSEDTEKLKLSCSERQGERLDDGTELFVSAHARDLRRCGPPT